MAVIYLGNNNESKKISNIYVSAGNNSKQVIKAYIGIDNVSKLFFISNIDIDLKQFTTIQAIENLTKVLSTYTSADLTYGKYAYFLSTESKLFLSNKIRYAYLNKDCSIHIYEEDENGVVENFFKKIRFDKVEDMNEAFSQFGPKLNLSNLKYFNNVINMNNAFYAAWYIYGSPIKAPNAINMANAYNECSNISGKIYIGEYVTNASDAFSNSGINSSVSLNLNSCNVGKYKAINLSNCFRNCKVRGNLNIYNYSSNLANIFIDRYKHDTGNIYIHMPKSKTLAQLNSYLSQFRICYSSEKHAIIDQTYIEIQTSAGVPYKVKFYNDL